ncbi:MAG: S8 family serine peptidase [Syntrophothermus sp.]
MLRFIWIYVIFCPFFMFSQSDYHDNILNIKINPNSSLNFIFGKDDNNIITTGIPEIDNLNKIHKCIGITKYFPNIEENDLNLWYSFTFEESSSIETIKNDYSLLAEFQIVELYPIPKVALIPNDPLLTYNESPSLHHMRLPEAWNVQTGNSSVVIAVIDNGLDYRHPDMSINNIYQNTTGGIYGYGEDFDQDGVTFIIQNGQKILDPGDINGIDDDGNGKIDDLAGWNLEGNNNILPSSLHQNNMHGLAISGIIVGTANNGIGASGVAYNSRVLHIKAGDFNYIYGDWISAIIYAADEGARIINMSFFGPGQSQMAQDAINYAYYNKNCIIVAAAGHISSGSCPIDTKSYPASYDNVISTGVLDIEGIHMRLINLVSNKVDILGSQALRYPWFDGAIYNYGWSISTSGTAALTSGLAALLIAHYPTWNNDKIINQIFSTCSSRDDDNRSNSNVCNFDFYGKIGHGQIDAFKALTFDGNINEDLVWNRELNIYHDITVHSDVTLTLRENTKLNFLNNKTFAVSGTLRILGNIEINNTNIQMNPGANLIIEPGAVVTFNSNTTIADGSLNTSTGWFGNYTINNNLIIPTGIVLDIYPQSKISIQNNASISVNGILNANGCKIGDGVLNWGSLVFDGIYSSLSILNSVTIEKANEIRCIDNANIRILNSSILNCNHGIYIYNSQPQIQNNNILDTYGNGIYGDANGKSPLITNNRIIKSTSNLYNFQGIYLLNNSNPYVITNDIQGYNYGIYIAGGGTCLFTDEELITPFINNRFANNNTGVVCAWGSFLHAGSNWGGHYNSILNNRNYDVYAYQYGTLYADLNWWGNDGVQATTHTYGVIQSNNPLPFDPWAEELSMTQIIPNLIKENNESDDIFIGLNFEKQQKYFEAVQHYKEMVQNNSLNSNFAISRLSKIMKYHKDEVLLFLRKLMTSNSLYKEYAISVLAGYYIDNNLFSEGIDLYNQLIHFYPNSYFGISARFAKFFATLHLEKNTFLATQYLNEIKQLNLSNNDYLMMIELAQGQLLNNLPKNSNISKNTSDKINTNLEYSLLQNYPNPFNPITSINYNIATSGIVYISLFDLLGKEVKILVNEYKQAGSYSILLDASNLPSGVYFYSLRINGCSFSRKMSLIK